MYVHNWHKWQMRRRDRAQPPYIKLHRIVLRDQAWASLSDSQKGQLVSLWIVAADKDGELPDDPKILQKIAGLDSEPDIAFFQAVGFIDSCQDGASVASSWRQDDATARTFDGHLTAKGKERKGKEREGKGAPPPSSAAPDPSPSVGVTPKQEAYARALLDQHGLSLEGWLAEHGEKALTASLLNAIVSGYRGTSREAIDAQRASRRFLLAELESRAAEDGIEAAEAWISGRKTDSHTHALARRLAILKDETKDQKGET